jgi:alkylation response protein AidB-like acyl-CoA dehydrogenase
LRPLDWSPLAEVVFDGVAVPSQNVVATGEQATHLLAEVMLCSDTAACCELLGVAKAALELAVEYAGTRVAFGRPIGSFQAVKARLVNLRMDVEVATALCQAATQDIVLGAPDRAVSVARAAFWCADTLRRVPEGALQVFGGIGFTWDHDIHLFLRRAATLKALLGEPARFREVVVNAMDEGS